MFWMIRYLFWIPRHWKHDGRYYVYRYDGRGRISCSVCGKSFWK